MNSQNLKRFINRVALVAGLGAGAAFVVPPASVSAQDGENSTRQRGHGEGRGHRHGHHRGHGMRAFEQLNLTANQKAQIEAIRESAREQRRELRGTEGHREQMRAAHQESRRLMMDVLTPAQKAQLETLRETRQTAHLDRRIGRMTEKLSLTEAQATRIRAIFEASKTQRQALRNGSDAGVERRQAMQGLRERTEAAVAAVLSAEQRTALEAMHAERGRRHHGPRGERGARPAR